MKDRLLGAVYGSIIGDVIGSFNEFKTKDTKRGKGLRILTEELLKRERNSFGRKFGYFTDDTTMTLITMNRLAKDGDISNKMMDDFLRWYRQGYMSSTSECFDIGGQTLRSLREYSGWKQDYPYPSDGNGALMRIFPIPFFWQDNTYSSKSDEANDLTHKNSLLSKTYCYNFCLALHNIQKGMNKEDVLDILGYQSEFDKDVSTSGFVVDTYRAVVHTFKKFDNLMDGIYYLANLGDDSDTCAAIYGALAGAFYGFEKSNIPQWMLDSLQKKETIERITEEFYGRIINMPTKSSREV